MKKKFVDIDKIVKEQFDARQILEQLQETFAKEFCDKYIELFVKNFKRNVMPYSWFQRDIEPHLIDLERALRITNDELSKKILDKPHIH